MVFVFLVTYHFSNAATVTAISDGDWHDPTNWDCGCIPSGAGTDVVIDGRSISIKTATGNITIGTVSITNASGSALAHLEVLDNVTFTVSGNLNLTAQDVGKAVSFRAANTSTTNISGNVTIIRTADNTKSNKLQLKMEASVAVNVGGNLTFNYLNAANGEGSLELDLNGTNVLTVSGDVNLLLAGGNRFTCNLDNSAQFNIGGAFTATQSGGNIFLTSIGTDCLFSVTDNATFINSGSTTDMRFTGTGNSNLTVGGNLNLTSSTVDKVLDFGTGGNINVTGNLNFSALSAADIDLDFTTNAILNLGGLITRASDFGIITMGPSAKIAYNGTGIQQLAKNAGSGGDSFEFTNVEINNTSGQPLSLEGTVNITRHLTLTSGIIEPTAINRLILDGSGASSDIGSATSHVDGPITKTGNGAFTFPVGDNGVSAPIAMSAPGNSGDFTAQYFNAAHSSTSVTGELTKVSPVEYWTLDRTAGNDVEVTLHWTDADQSEIYNLTDLRVAKYNGSTWQSEGNQITTGGTGSGVSGTIESNAVTTFSPFTFGTVAATNFLPVELMDFRAKVADNNLSVKLVWSTATETNNDYFEIERSIDGKRFSTIGKVLGNGNTLVESHYSFNDDKPISDVLYYRLKQTDYDGNYGYSEIISVKLGHQGLVRGTLFPNPTVDQVNLELASLDYNGEINIQITNVNGQVFTNRNISWNDQDANLNIDVSHLPTGMYFLECWTKKREASLEV